MKLKLNLPESIKQRR